MMSFLLYIILTFVSAVSITVGLYLTFRDGKIALLFFIGIAMTISTIYFGNPKLSKSPTKQDVIDGKAIYQEIQIITGNDTIKTYNIVWKKENF